MLLLADWGRVHRVEEGDISDSKILQWTSFLPEMFSKNSCLGEDLMDRILDPPSLRIGGEYEYFSACNWVNPAYPDPQVFKDLMAFNTPVRPSSST